jgi:hypothetical protein
MRIAALLATALALVVATAAAGVGPSLPDVNGAVSAAEVSYVTAAGGTSTTLSKRVEGRVVTRTVLPGAFGVPLVTLSGGEHGGLSPDGRTLVLGNNVRPDGTLRTRSQFAVVSTPKLALARTISLRGDYSFDALSPRGTWLYLIHHMATASGTRYQVRAYDLRAGKLLPGVIADKRQADWLMAGYPVSRATSTGGRWVYTLYQQPDNYPFVHALDTVNRTAVCIGLPWQWAGDAQGRAIGTAKLSLAGHTLTIAGGIGSQQGFTLDTSTFKVKKN